MCGSLLYLNLYMEDLKKNPLLIKYYGLLNSNNCVLG